MSSFRFVGIVLEVRIEGVKIYHALQKSQTTPVVFGFDLAVRGQHSHGLIVSATRAKIQKIILPCPPLLRQQAGFPSTSARVEILFGTCHAGHEPPPCARVLDPE